MKLRALNQTIKELGWWHGLQFFLSIKLKLRSKFSLPFSKHSIFIRPESSDFMVFEQIFLEKHYDLPFPENIATIIDAGANTGLASIYFASKFPNARIIAIEPESNNFNTLSKNTEHFDKIAKYQKALWHEKTNLNLFDQGNKEWAFMTVENHGNGANVETITLAEIVDEHGLDVIDILKIDIEGSEKEVFSEAFDSWLPKVKCLIIELHDYYKPGASDSVYSALSKYDFEESKKGENLVFINRNLV